MGEGYLPHGRSFISYFPLPFHWFFLKEGYQEKRAREKDRLEKKMMERGEPWKSSLVVEVLPNLVHNLLLTHSAGEPY